MWILLNLVDSIEFFCIHHKALAVAVYLFTQTFGLIV